jgi:NAD(P)-dependent dehydrogenase (short-subunit alcohol dehydrogenase family)
MSVKPSQTAIVTGAGSGIGRALATQLSQLGYHVVLVGRTESTLDETSQQLESPFSIHATDIADAQACRDLVNQVASQLGRIDVLANIAGVAPSLTIDQITPELWQETIDTNLSSVVNLTAACWPIFEKQKSGFVGSISSMASIDPFPGFSIYAAAKAGVNLFTLVAGREGEKIGVRAMAVAPGAVETGMLRKLFDESVIPADATLSPEEVARVIVDCLEKKREFTAGQTIALPSP